MGKLYLNQERRTLRAAMSVVAALCVLGLAGLVVLHDGWTPGIVVSARPAVVSDAAAMGDSGMPVATGVPSAESVFRGAAYAPEEPITQF